MAAHAAAPIRALVVVGGHDFETNQFYQVFRDNPDVTFRVVEHPSAHAQLTAPAARDYDVLVLYDMWARIDDAAKADFVARLAEGKGLVALHHALCSYQDWDEYRRIIGGRYHLAKRIENGRELPAATYRHDVRFLVRIQTPGHPITRGVTEFEILDETYGGFEVLPGVEPLLGTTEPTSGPVIAWAHTYKAARVVYLQLGHDHHAYENPQYRRILAQALRWTARHD
jgi:hypothetical protein